MENELEVVRRIRAQAPDESDLSEVILATALRGFAIATWLLLEQAGPGFEVSVPRRKRRQLSYAIRTLFRRWKEPMPKPLDETDLRNRALFDAIYDGSAEQVRKWLGEGASPSCGDGWGRALEMESVRWPAFHSAVHLATESSGDEAIDVVRAFLDHGVDPNLENSAAETPLVAAFWSGALPSADSISRRFDLAKLILDAGGDAARLSNQGRSVLHYWARHASADGPILDLLLRAGAPIDAQDHSGRTALHVAIDERYAEGAKDHQNIALMLIDVGANSWPKTGKGRTPYRLAVRASRTRPMDRLLDYYRAFEGRTNAADE